MSDKLTQEELQELQQFRFNANQLAASLGDLHYQRAILDLELDRVKEGIKENLQKQQAHLRELGQKYGDVSINFEDGSLRKFEEKAVDSE
jgi:hypothetical protein